MYDVTHLLDLLEEIRTFVNQPTLDGGPVDQIDEVIRELRKLDQGYANIRPATQNQIGRVLACTDTTSGDGRSPWYWLMMPNGDQLLATYPQGSLYMDICDDTPPL